MVYGQEIAMSNELQKEPCSKSVCGVHGVSGVTSEIKRQPVDEAAEAISKSASGNQPVTRSLLKV
jgi:hypothetical protein